VYPPATCKEKISRKSTIWDFTKKETSLQKQRGLTLTFMALFWKSVDTEK
jgi:hypothetical protein